MPSSATNIQTTYLQNGMSFDLTGVQNPLGQGVQVPPICNFVVIPKAISTNYVAATQNITNGVAMTLNSANMTQFNSQNLLVLDCQRCIKVTFSANISANTTFTINGYDWRWKPIQETLVVASGTSVGTTVKSFFMVTSITPNQTNSSQTCIVGTSDFIGLPFYLNYDSSLNTGYWNEAALSTTDIAPGFAWRTNGQVTATSIDSNGLVTLPSASNGAKILRVNYYVYGADPALQAMLYNQENSVVPYNFSTSAITYARIQRNTSNTKYVYGSLMDYDVCGPQYPADSAFIAAYQASLAS